jgi:hypothetical protein
MAEFYCIIWRDARKKNASYSEYYQIGAERSQFSVGKIAKFTIIKKVITKQLVWDSFMSTGEPKALRRLIPMDRQANRPHRRGGRFLD